MFRGKLRARPACGLRRQTNQSAACFRNRSLDHLHFYCIVPGCSPRARQATVLPVLSLNCKAAFISSPRRSGCSGSGCPIAQLFFLNFDDQLGVFQLLRQAGNIGLQIAILLDLRADHDLGAALLGREGIKLSLFVLPLPGAQVRKVQPSRRSKVPIAPES